MTLLEALNEGIAKGLPIVSCETMYMYSAEELELNWYGKHYASYNGSEISEKEKKGNWEVIG